MSKTLSTLGLLGLLAVQAHAESPVVLKVRKTVAALDALRLKKTKTEKAVEGGEEALTLWKDKNSKRVKALVGDYGDDGPATETTLYWENGVLLFVFWSETGWEGINRPQGPSKTMVEEKRLYYDKGKPAVFRAGKRSAPGDVKHLKVESKDVPLEDSRCKELIDDVATMLKERLK